VITKTTQIQTRTPTANYTLAKTKKTGGAGDADCGPNVLKRREGTISGACTFSKKTRPAVSRITQPGVKPPSQGNTGQTRKKNAAGAGTSTPPKLSKVGTLGQAPETAVKHLSNSVLSKTTGPQATVQRLASSGSIAKDGSVTKKGSVTSKSPTAGNTPTPVKENHTNAPKVAPQNSAGKRTYA
jgi:hypothetical protein